MKLYYAPGACSLSPHILALEAGIDLELVKVDTKTKTIAAEGDYWAINPKGYVPALALDDGEILTEGPAIVQYLGDRKPGSGLVPPCGSMERYRLQEMLGYINSEIHKTFSPLFNKELPEATRADRKAYLKKRYAYIEKQLAGKDYLFGDKFGAADAYLFTVTTWSRPVALDLSEFPNVLAFQKRVASRPAVQAAMKAEGLVTSRRMRRLALALLVLALPIAGTGAAHRQAGAARPALGGGHRQAARRDRRRDDFPEGRQRGGRRVRDARRGLHDVGHARLGRRDAGADLQPAHEEGHRDQRPRRRADRRHARVLPVEGDGVPAGVRPARRGHAGHARRPACHARRVRQAQPEGGARTGDPDGRRLSPSSAGRRRDRAPEEGASRSGRLGEGLADRTRANRARLPSPARSSSQADLAATLRKLVDAEQQALKAGKSRARRRSTPPTTASTRATSRREFVARLARAGRTLHTVEDLANWKVHIEEPVVTNYKGIQVYKLTTWVQGPVMLQALNLLETMDLKAMGYNSARYIHTLYQAMNLAFADRDFYYGDPVLAAGGTDQGPAVEGVCTRASEADQLGEERSEGEARRPVPVPGRHEPLHGPARRNWPPPAAPEPTRRRKRERSFEEAFMAGTTSIEAADEEGWVVSVTPSGGWIPASIAGTHRHRHEPAHAGIRARRGESPFNVVRARPAPARRRSRRAWRSRTASPTSRSPCRAATARTRTCCSSSSTSSNSG